MQARKRERRTEALPEGMTSVCQGPLDKTLVAPDVRRLYDSAWKREGTDMLTMEVEQPMRARKAHKRNEHGLANCLKHRMRG